MTVPFGPTTTPVEQLDVKYVETFWRDCVRESGFKPYMGECSKGNTAGLMKPICIMKTNVGGGNTTKIPLLTRLRNSGTPGNGTLVGREEEVGKYTFTSRIEYMRHAIVTKKREEHFSFVKMVGSKRPLLKEWSATRQRNLIIDGLNMVRTNAGSGLQDELVGVSMINRDDPLDEVTSVTATAATLNGYLDDNYDRIMIGPQHTTNLIAGNFAGSLAAIAPAQIATARMVTDMKRKARMSDPIIRPLRLGDQGREYYVLFCDSISFDQLFHDPEIKAINLDTRERGTEKNPLFQDGDLLYRGVIIREIPEIMPLDKAQYSTQVNIGRMYLCGAQALAFSWGQAPIFTARDETDYGFAKGVGIEEAAGCQAIQFALPKDNAVPTGPKRMINFGKVDGYCSGREL